MKNPDTLKKHGHMPPIGGKLQSSKRKNENHQNNHRINFSVKGNQS